MTETDTTPPCEGNERDERNRAINRLVASPQYRRLGFRGQIDALEVLFRRYPLKAEENEA